MERVRKKHSHLSAHERLIIAQQLHAGMTRHRAAILFDISLYYVHCIFHEHLEYKLTWRRNKKFLHGLEEYD